MPTSSGFTMGKVHPKKTTNKMFDKLRFTSSLGNKIRDKRNKHTRQFSTSSHSSNSVNNVTAATANTSSNNNYYNQHFIGSNSKINNYPTHTTSSIFNSTLSSDDNISLYSATSIGLNETDSLSSAIFDISKMCDEEINSKFEEMLDDMNLSEEKKAPLRSRDLKMKRDMLSMHFKGVLQKGMGKVASPVDYTKVLCQSNLSPIKLLQWLESLRVALSSNPVSWVQDFGTMGLNSILRNLSISYDDTKTESMAYQRIQHECIRCLKACMNNKFGLTQIREHEDALIIMAKSINPSHPNLMIDTVKLMAAVCLIPPDGHSKVLEALTIYADSEDFNRFEPICQGLSFLENSILAVSCFQLINALISTPDDLDLRMHLRNEFMRSGLSELMEMLTISKDPNIILQLSVFTDHKNEDFDEFCHKADSVKFEYDDLEECFKVIKTNTSGSFAEKYFLSILQHLLCIRPIEETRTAYFKLIEECVSQIVLHKNGLDPDFRCSQRFQINVEPLIESIINKSESASNDSSVISCSNTKRFDESIPKNLNSELLNAKISECTESSIPTPPPMPPPLPPQSNIPSAPPLPMDVQDSANNSGCPPPPPLPPISLSYANGANCNNIPAPPPPPPTLNYLPSNQTQLPPFLKEKLKYSVMSKLRRINWEKIDAKKLSESSFWAKCDENSLVTSEFKTILEEQFSTSVGLPSSKRISACSFGQAFSSVPNSFQGDDNISSLQSSFNTLAKKNIKQRKVLDAKTSQNLSIFLASIKRPYEEIRNAILSLDDNVLTEGILCQLIKCMPTQEQLSSLSEYRETYASLVEAEQFAVTVSDIKRIIPRLNCMLFRSKFAESVNDVKTMIDTCHACCLGLLKSQNFASILQIMLAIGNYLNAGSNNAQAYAFNITFLSKLHTIKTKSHKANMLNFLVDYFEKNNPDVLHLSDELTHLQKASNVSIETLKSNMLSIKKSFQLAENELKNKEKEDIVPPQDQFLPIMTFFYAFLHPSQEEFLKIESSFTSLETCISQVVQFFAIDTKKNKIEDVFCDINSFIINFNKIVREHQKQKLAEAKKSKLQEMKKEREIQARTSLMPQRRTLVDLNADGDQEGVIDNLLAALQSGSAFHNHGRRRGPKSHAIKRVELQRTKSKNDLLATLENSNCRFPAPKGKPF